MWLPPRKCSQSSHETGSGALLLKKVICKYQDGQNRLERGKATTTATTLLTTLFTCWFCCFRLPLILVSFLPRKRRWRPSLFPSSVVAFFEAVDLCRRWWQSTYVAFWKEPMKVLLALIPHPRVLSWFIFHLSRIHNWALIIVVTGPLCSWLLEDRANSASSGSGPTLKVEGVFCEVEHVNL